MAGAVSACSDSEAVVIESGEVTRQTVVEVVEAPASVTAAAAASVASPASGAVQSLRVRDGQQVRKGEVLFVISSPETMRSLGEARQAAAAAPQPISVPPVAPTDQTQQAIADAEQAFDQARRAAQQIPIRQVRRQALAQIAQARAQTASAGAQADATAAQLNQGIASLQQALAGLTQAQQVQSQAAVQSAERAVAALTVRAPIGGRVIFGPGASTAAGTGDLGGLVDSLPGALSGQAESLLGGGSESSSSGSTTGTLRPGSPVSSGDPVMSITDVSELSLRAEVDETDVLLVHKRVAADVELDAVPGASYRAVVRNVDLSPTTSSRGGVTYVVRMQLLGGTLVSGGPAPRPRPGMSAVASLRVLIEKNAIAAPVSSVFRDGEADAVWLDDDGLARKLNVTVGAQGEDYLQVTEGLEVGQRIVVRGADQVSEGQELS